MCRAVVRGGAQSRKFSISFSNARGFAKNLSQFSQDKHMTLSPGARFVIQLFPNVKV